MCLIGSACHTYPFTEACLGIVFFKCLPDAIADVRVEPMIAVEFKIGYIAKQAKIWPPSHQRRFSRGEPLGSYTLMVVVEVVVKAGMLKPWLDHGVKMRPK